MDVCEVVSAAGKRAGLKQAVTPKMLRHSFATHLMDRGVDLAVIASLMGHRSAHETGVYLHRLPGRAEAAVKLLEPNPEGQPMKWDYWIALYLNTHCMARGLRALTIKAYAATLKGFRQYAQDAAGPNAVRTN